MPKLLKNGMVQLHMPRTGGTSLARDVGVQDYWNGLHDGVNQIPDHWKDKKRIATWRDPVSWSESMINYLIKNK